MSANTTIEWTRNDDGTPGRTWNPATGCTKISVGCDNCYAETIAERFRGYAAFPNGFDVQVRANKVNDPLTWRKPTRVFVNSMSDMFHADIDQAWIADVFAVMAAAQKHTFQLLTKRHARMRSLLNSPEFIAQVRSRALGKGLPADQWQWPIANLWLGVSVENQEWADIRIRPLMQTPAAVRFLSCEPLLGPIKLHRGHTHCPTHDFPGGFCTGGCPDLIAPNWVIVGGESGRKARPMDPQWATSLRDQCAEADIPYFFKQWGEWAPSGYLVIRSRPEPGSVLVGDPVDDLGHRIELRRVGKKAAGRELDGLEHNAFPEPR
ncbi:MAG: hypothetical protein JWO67_3001 [Streptosporangiaceae bacterium]|nr:hypothetical protein [Streptosporangiaceae bacterium]